MISLQAKNHRKVVSERRLNRVLGQVLLLTFIFFFQFVVRQIVGPLLPAVEAEMGLRHTQGGLFVFSLGLGFFISQLGAAFFAARWGYRRCILISIWGCAVGAMVLGLVDALPSLYGGFLLLGLCGGLYIPSAFALLTAMVRPQDWGKALATHELAPNIALIAVPFIATAAISLHSWRLAYLAVSGVLVLLGFVHALVGTDVPDRPPPPDLRRIREIAANPDFWRLGLLLSLGVGIETGVYSMIPLFLTSEKAFALADANQLLGLSRIPAVVMVLVSGWIADRTRPALTITITLGLTGLAVIVLGIGPKYLTAPAVYLQAAASAAFFPPVLAMTSQISRADNRALTFSLILAVAPAVGGGLLPAGIALAGDLGSFAAGMAGAGLLTLCGIALIKNPPPGRR